MLVAPNAVYPDLVTQFLVCTFLQVAGLEAKVAELSALYKAEYDAHVITKEAVPALEKMISERDAQIDFLTKNVTTMEVRLSDKTPENPTRETPENLTRETPEKHLN